jgi:hypothetical protein
MADIFGQTAIVPFANDNKIRLTISGLDNAKIFLTSVDSNVKPNYQLQYSVGAARFINSFNHRLSMLNIEGKYVLANCNGPLDASSEPPFMQFYKQNNISTSQNPIKISYSGIVINGFLISLDTGRHNQEQVDGFGFRMGFLGAIDGLNPPASSGGGSGSGSEGYSNPSKYTPGKTGPNRAGENTASRFNVLANAKLSNSLYQSALSLNNNLSRPLPITNRSRPLAVTDRGIRSISGRRTKDGGVF